MVEREITGIKIKSPERLGTPGSLKIVLGSVLRLRKIFGPDLDSSNFQLSSPHINDIQLDLQVQYRISLSTSDIREHLTFLYELFTSSLPMVQQYSADYCEKAYQEQLPQFILEECQNDFIFSLLCDFLTTSTFFLSRDIKSAFFLFLKERLKTLNSRLKLAYSEHKRTLKKENREELALEQWYLEAPKISLAHFFQVVSCLNIHEQRIILNYFGYKINQGESTKTVLFRILKKLTDSTGIIHHTNEVFSITDILRVFGKSPNFKQVVVNNIRPLIKPKKRYTYERPLGNKLYKEVASQASENAEPLLKKLKTLINLDDLKATISSFNRVQNIYGINSAEIEPNEATQFFGNVQFDHLIFFYVNQSIDQLITVMEIILEITEGYDPLAQTLAQTYLKKSAYKNTEGASIESFVSNFVVEQVKNFFLLSQGTKALQLSKLSAYLKATFNKKLKLNLQRHLESLYEPDKNSSRRRVDKKIENWQTAAEDIDIPQFLYLVSKLSIREQLIVLFKFQYLKLEKYREFFVKYNISMSFYYGHLHHALDQLIIATEDSNIPSLDPTTASTLIDQVNSIKPTQLLRYKSGHVIEDGNTSMQLAELIIQQGDQLLETTLSGQQRRVLSFLIEHYSKHNVFPTMDDLADHFGTKKNTIKELYERILKAITEPDNFYVKTKGIEHVTVPSGTALHIVLSALHEGRLDRTLFSRAENYVLDFYRNSVGNVYPNSQEIGEALGLSFETVRYHVKIAGQKLKARQNNTV